jgi:LPXTG-motif cell wall-anchored protein
MRIAVSLACVGVMAFSGLPQLTGQAEAARRPPSPGKPCDQKFGTSGTSAAPGSQPWETDGSVRPTIDWDSYGYTNPRESFDGLTLPDDPQERADFLKKIGTNYRRYKTDDPRRVYARYNRNQRYGKRKAPSFDSYLRNDYIGTYGNLWRGNAFHRKLVNDLGLHGPDWMCEVEIDVKDPDTGKTYRRRLDAVNHKTGEFVEAKAGGAHDDKQNASTRALMKDPKYRNYRMRYVFGGEQEPETKSLMNKFRQEFGRNSLGHRRLTTYEHRSLGIPQYERTKYSRQDTNLAPPGRYSYAGGAAKVVDGSPPSREIARRENAYVRTLDPGGNRGRAPGGVDFTSLELRYVGKPVKGKGIDYAFSAKKNPDPNGNPSFGGKAKAKLISDSFFAWLALTPDKFWVNLNPDQPDRVMDSKFASTDAGRVLLEADLQMKHDFFKAMDPKTDLGTRFWADLPRVDGHPCFTGIRNWIEPKPAKVREQDGGIYILDAPLHLKSTEQDFTTQPGGGEGVCHPTKAQRDQAQDVIDREIVPAVEKTINTAPQYADLRRVYTARVAAEWIRLQDANSPTDYHDIINTNDVRRWPLRAPNQKWDKNELFRRYQKIFINGEFKYDVDTEQGVEVHIVGGVDFSKAPKRNITALRFRAQHRNLPRTTKDSVKAMTDDADDPSMLYLGGTTDTSAAPHPHPTPTPTPTYTGPATATPAPTQSGGHHTPPADNGKQGDKGGGLANTGAQVLTVAAIAAALLVAGVALIWFRRRRTHGS